MGEGSQRFDKLVVRFHDRVIGNEFASKGDYCFARAIVWIIGKKVLDCGGFAFAVAERAILFAAIVVRGPIVAAIRNRRVVKLGDNAAAFENRRDKHINLAPMLLLCDEVIAHAHSDTA